MATVSSGMPVGRVAWEKSQRPMTGPLKTSVHRPLPPTRFGRASAGPRLHQGGRRITARSEPVMNRLPRLRWHPVEATPSAPGGIATRKESDR